MRRGRIALAVFATFVSALFLFHSLVVALAASIALLTSVAEFLLPLRYALAADAARVSCGPVTWLEMPWPTVKHVYRVPGGIKLSPFRSPKTAVLEPLRGITLRCDRDDVPTILETIETLRGQAIGCEAQ